LLQLPIVVGFGSSTYAACRSRDCDRVSLIENTRVSQVGYGDLDGLGSPMAQQALSAVTALRTMVEAQQSAVQLKLTEAVREETSRAAQGFASADELRTLRHESVVLSTRLSALREELARGGGVMATGQGVGARAEGEEGADGGEKRAAISMTQQRAPELSDAVARLAATVRDDRAAAEAAMARLDGTMRMQWEETCKGLDLAAELARTSSEQTATAEAELRPAVTALQEALVRVRGVASLRPSRPAWPFPVTA
jgi:chromosome segregation ATPase